MKWKKKKFTKKKQINGTIQWNSMTVLKFIKNKTIKRKRRKILIKNILKKIK